MKIIRPHKQAILPKIIYYIIPIKFNLFLSDSFDLFPKIKDINTHTNEFEDNIIPIISWLTFFKWASKGNIGN